MGKTAPGIRRKSTLQQEAGNPGPERYLRRRNDARRGTCQGEKLTARLLAACVFGAKLVRSNVQFCRQGLQASQPPAAGAFLKAHWPLPLGAEEVEIASGIRGAGPAAGRPGCSRPRGRVWLVGSRVLAASDVERFVQSCTTAAACNCLLMRSATSVHSAPDIR